MVVGQLPFTNHINRRTHRRGWRNRHYWWWVVVVIGRAQSTQPIVNSVRCVVVVGAVMIVRWRVIVVVAGIAGRRERGRMLDVRFRSRVATRRVRRRVGRFTIRWWWCGIWTIGIPGGGRATRCFWTIEIGGSRWRRLVLQLLTTLRPSVLEPNLQGREREIDS